jgi:hypothetical protein
MSKPNPLITKINKGMYVIYKSSSKTHSLGYKGKLNEYLFFYFQDNKGTASLAKYILYNIHQNL